MKLKELYLKNFGKFSGERFVFDEGINIIYGSNEAGKTTMYHAIGGLLFGIDKQRGKAARTDTYTAYQPWENKTWYEGSLRFETGGKLFLLERNFYHGEKSARLVCETDGEELSVEQGDLEAILGDLNGELFFNTAAVGQLKMKPRDIVYSYLKNYIVSLQEAGGQGTDVVRALNILEGKRKALEQQKKRQTAEIYQQAEKLDARLELLERELSDARKQLRMTSERRERLLEEIPEERGFFVRILRWLKRLFFGRQLRAQQRQRREAQLKLEEKICFLKEVLGEKESLREEFLLEKESLYEKLHEQSKDEEIQALLLAMERIRELSAVRKEEVMERLLDKASQALCRMTGGKYQKLFLEEKEEPAIWDAARKQKLKLFQVSTGCAEQVYLSLRIALQDLFFEEDTMPLIFDDAFVYFDDERLERLLGYLSGLERQVLIFTCHKREERILGRLQISYRTVSLHCDEADLDADGK